MSWKKTLRRARDAALSRRLYRDGAVEISALRGEGETGIVVFTSLNDNFAQGGHLEFAGTASGGGRRPSVFVRDPRRSWFQDRDAMLRTVETVAAHWRGTGVRRIVTMGDSMGAYGAIVFARDLGADAALAFGPQYDVSRAAMPEDPRWKAERDAVAEFGLGCVEPWMSAAVDYYLLHGRQGPDILHWSRFPQGPNIHHYLLAGFGHAVAPQLKAKGQLGALLETVLAADTAAADRLLFSLGAARRRPGEDFRTRPNNWYRHRFPALMAGVDLSGTPHEETLHDRR